MSELRDVDTAKTVELVVDDTGKVWVNMDGRCVLRIGHAHKVTADDPNRGLEIVYADEAAVELKDDLDVQHVMRYTGFKDVETATAALETLKWLEEGAPEKFDGLKGQFYFDMKYFVSLKAPRGFVNPTRDCGTMCCIAGAISQFKKRKSNDEYDVTKEDGFGVFGLTATDLDAEFTNAPHLNDFQTWQLGELFYARRLLKYVGHLDITTLGKIKPDKAAIVLRHYLVTGETDWHLAYPDYENRRRAVFDD